MMRLRVGGVPEHFNLPWRLAIEDGLHPEVDAQWVDFPGGTGAIMEALDQGTIDLATPLTEGAITAIAGGSSARILGMWVDSPLLWGIHVAADSEANDVADVATGRFAISRFGSGSELMSRMLARDRGWAVDQDRFVVVKNLDGALAALPAGQAEVFLWNKSMTQPHVDAGTFKRIGVYPTPWPAFCVATRTDLAREHGSLLRAAWGTAGQRGRALMGDTGLPRLAAERYGLALAEATEWSEQVQWTDPDVPIDPELLRRVAETMRALGRVDRQVDPHELMA